jgi:hypothetical protein
MQTLFPFLRRNFFWAVTVVAILLLAVAFEAGRWSVYHAHPELSQAEQAATILNNVGHLIQLPSGETPTMATINNAASAKTSQPFLVNAQDGDVLIVYPDAGEALLYRPSTDKLIAVGPVDNGAPSQAQAETPISPPATTTDATETPSKK